MSDGGRKRQYKRLNMEHDETWQWKDKQVNTVVQSSKSSFKLP